MAEIAVEDANAPEIRFCYFCYTEAAVTTPEEKQLWVRPCKCRGSTKWVHQHCMRTWIVQRWNGSQSMHLRCSMCTAPYRTVSIRTGRFIIVMDYMNDCLQTFENFLAVFVAPLAIPLMILTGHTVMMVLVSYGIKEGSRKLVTAEPWKMVPLFSLNLFCVSWISWENFVVDRLILYFQRPQRRLRNIARCREESTCRVWCNMFFLTPVACGIGTKLLSNVIKNPLTSAMLSTAAAVAITGACTVYYKYSQAVRRLNGVILN